MIAPHLTKILDRFSGSFNSVQELMTFDRLVLDFAITQIQSIDNRLGSLHEFSGVRTTASHAITQLRNIRANDSLRPHYEQMLNQCNVLLVSYFSSAVGDIFRTSVGEAVKRGDRPAVLREEIKIGLKDIHEIGSDMINRTGELLAAYRDISFQDMQSIGRAFRDYFGYDAAKDQVVNDIITSQACRHVIVHSGTVADRKMIGQLRAAHPRTLKPNIKEGDVVQFTEDEVMIAGNQMLAYLRDLAMSLTAVERTVE